MTDLLAVDEKATEGGLGAEMSIEELIERGYSALKQSGPGTALSYFAQALAREPDHPDLLNDCGGIHGVLGQHDQAVAFFQRALRLEPQNVEVLNNLGLALGALGRHEEAKGPLLQAVALRPDYFDALCNLGFSLNQLGQFEQALGYLDQALAQQSTHPGALCNRGIALAGLDRHALALESFDAVVRLGEGSFRVHALSGAAGSLIALGRPEEALKRLDEALHLDPGHAGALNNRGAALMRLGREAGAQECFERSLAVAANQSRALLEQAKSLQRLGRGAQALERIDRALGIDPNHQEAILNRGVVLVAENRYEEALECFDQVLRRDPGNLMALNNRAVALGRLRNLSAALTCLDEALAHHPGDFSTLLNRGIALDKLLRFEEALESFNQALAVQPDNLDALLDQAGTLFRLHRLSEAQKSLERILAIKPEHVEALTTLGAILWMQNENPRGRACLEQALALSPGHVNAVNNLSFIDLSEGRLREGFEGQEIRWKTELFANSAIFRSTAPLWLGKESLAGRTIYVHGEQGLGDVLQFVRYVRQLDAAGAKVLLDVPRTLRGLMENLPWATLVSENGNLPPHDFRCPVMSLPLACGTTMDTIPGSVPYLEADPERVEEWRERLGPSRRPRIGLVWAGRQYYPINYARDMSLRQLLPLLSVDAELISLQKEVPEADRELLDSLPHVLRLGETLDDFSDTAALVANLDLVIAVDTSIVHLSGALGKPTWIMNRFASCWRWLRDGRTDSPWYPTARLFRQPALGDWDPVVQAVRQAAEVFIAKWARPRAHAAVPQRAPSAAKLMRKAAALFKEGEHEQSIRTYTEILTANPNHVGALTALGSMLGQLELHEQALACLDRALTLQPASAELICNRGAALLALGHDSEALTCFDRALSLDSRNIPARFNRGVALLQRGERRRALVSFDEVLSADASHAETRHHRAQIYLALGNYRDGFRELESRWRTNALRGMMLPTRSPLWLGKEPLQGKTLLLHHEQGLPDALLMLRYVPHLAALASQVQLGFPRELRSLVQASFGSYPNVEVLEDRGGLPAHDYHCPILSLPLAFGTQLSTVPREIPYLRSGADRLDVWQASSVPGRPLRVGLAWREHPSDGQLGHGIGLGSLAALLALEADFVCLQEPEEEAKLLAGLPQLRVPADLGGDLLQSAALIETVDLVIGVDTAVTHLAGALGRPVWVLLTRAASWRWLQDRSDSPWYPSARLFRQGELGQWGPVVAQVAAALSGHLQGTPLPDPASVVSHLPASAPTQPGAAEAGALLSGQVPAASDPLNTLLQRAALLYQQRDYAGALACFEEALTAQPERVDVLDAAGQTLLRLGRPAEALTRFDRVLELDPLHAEGLHHRGLALLALDRTAAALAVYDRLLARNPDHVEALSTRAFALNQLDRYEEALASTEHALRLDDQSLGAHINRCVSLERLNRPHEALECIDEALRLQPAQFEALIGRGVVLSQLDRLPEALACYEAALALRPGQPDAVFNRCFIHLAQGDLVEGFKGYESRWRTQLSRSKELATSVPKWLGDTELAGRRILVYAEQGLGDTLQFCRYVPLLVERGAMPILRVPMSLKTVMRTLPCPVEVVSEQEPLPEHDLQCPLLSLPFAFGTSLDSIPARIPYLQADPERIAYWSARLGPRRRPRVGLVWAGHQVRPRNLPRDMSLRQLLPLRGLDADLISLQKEIPEADRGLLASWPGLANHGEALADFADTTGLVAQLDLLITVDTSVAHLAGALGKPVWILNRFSPCWRWLRGREDSPWYPTVRLFNQPVFGDWESVVNNLTPAAHAFVAAHAQGAS